MLIGGAQDALQKDYQVEATPTTYLLGEKGEVMFSARGYKPGDEKILEEKIMKLLNIQAETSATSSSLPVCGLLYRTL